jgi:hypothetical protein
MMDSPSGTPEAEETPVPSSAPEAATVPDPPVTARPAFRARLRGWSRGWPGRLVRWGAGALAVTVAVAIVATVTIDLGPLVRGRAEDAASNQLDREVSIGRIGMYLMPGKFLVEDLFIAGLTPDDEPFMTAERIAISVDWLALLHREFLVDAEMTSWRMRAESYADGTQSFPAFVPNRSSDEKEPVEPDPPPTDEDGEDGEDNDRWVATLRHLGATQGEFVLEDYGSNFGVVCANLTVSITKIFDYRGDASCTGGSIRVSDFEPMWMDMATNFLLDGSQVYLSRVDVETDGASTRVVGDVDMRNLAEMTYELESDLDLPRLREIFFADDGFTASGEAHFTGTFQKFEDGYDLSGAITSPLLGLATDGGQFRFPSLEGQLVWQPDRFDMWDVTSTLFGGDVRAELTTFGTKDPWQGTFDAHYEDADVVELARFFELSGIQPIARASGHNQMEWPTARSGGSRHTGTIQLHPLEGVTLATAVLAPGAAQRVASRSGQPPDLTTTEFQVGGALDYVFEGDAIELTSGYIATPSTHVTFDGRTGGDAPTRIPFRATSSDWQEGYRLMTAVMTAVGSPTEPFEVDGAGTFEGVMLGDLARPRVEATFAGEALHAWNVDWGVGGGGIVVDNGYLEVRNGLFRNDGAEFGADGTFSIGGSDVDGGEDINAVVTMVSFPTSHIRSAFGLEDGYTIDGPATGEVRLYGPYRAMFGYGQVVLEQPIAYGEPIDSASSGLRFEGNGVRLDGFEMRKGSGTVTGAAFIGWDASYVFNWDVRDLEINTVTSMPAPPEPLSGVVNFNIAGVGAFDDPRYEISGTVVDLFVGDEEIGQVTTRLSVRDDLLTVNLEGASSTLAVSAAGQVEMTDMLTDLRVRVTNASLAPYVRMFDPRLSPYTSAVVSGSAHIQGQLQTDRVRVDATIEQADLTLLEYDLRNDGPIELRLDGQAIVIDRLRLVGEGTALDLSGSVDLATDALGLDIDGDANLGILRGLVPDLRGSGVAQVRTRVRGTFAQPELAGQAALLNGRIRHIGLPHGLEAINGRVLFEEGGLRFDDIPAVMGGGAVTIGGRVGLDGVDLQELAITLTGREMQWRYPVGFRSLVDANLVLRGGAASPVLAGTIDVRDANLLDGLDLGTGLFSGGEDELEVEVPESDASVLPLALDIRVVAPSSLRMTSNAVRVVASADLTVQGTYDQPQLFGSADMESGEAFFEGLRYRLNYGTISLANPNKIEPFVNVEVETDVRVPGQTYRVTVQATGSTDDQFALNFSSDPPLPEVDVIGLLLGDIRDPQSADLRAARSPELAQQQRIQASAARLLTSSLSAGVGRVVEESFGVDSFQITPSLGDPSSQQSAQLNPTARVLIGQRISDRAHLMLSRAISGANRDLIVVFEYDQSDRLAWILSQNEDRTYALDFRVRHAF